MAEDLELIALQERNNWLEELSQVRAGVITEKDKRISVLESACEAALPPLKWTVKHKALPAELVEHTKALIEQLEGAIKHG